MSNHLAVATVTAVLRQMIQTAVANLIPGTLVDVTMVRPDQLTSSNGGPPTGVNIFLYQVTPNGAYGNTDLPTRGGDGTLTNRPCAALDLHYLISFHGVDKQLEPQRLLGRTVSALHASPVLTRSQVETFVAAAQAPSNMFHYLAESDLAESIELVKFTPAPLSLEEISRLWSIFFQTPYTLSVAYHATVVLLESADRPGHALPVRRSEAPASTFGPMAIEAVQSADGLDASIVAGTTLLILGHGFTMPGLRVRICGQLVEPKAVESRVVTLPLTVPPLKAGTLRAGVQEVQLVRFALVGEPPVERPGASSPPFVVVIRPTITKTGTAYDVLKVGPTLQNDGTWDFILRIGVDPPFGTKQHATVLLNERAPARPPGRSYAFDALPVVAPADPVDFPLRHVQPGDYLVRIRVDGAESELTLDGSDRYTSPRVVIP